MEYITLVLSAIAAIASVLSVVLVISNNKQHKRHLKNRLHALENENNSIFGYQNVPGKDYRVETETLKRDLGMLD